jgi:hypothetical protein
VSEPQASAPTTRLAVYAHIGGRRVPMFQVFGVAGLIAAAVVALECCRARGLPAWLVAVLAAASLVTFVGVAVLTKAALGRERLTYYHHELAVFAVVAIVAGALRQPVLATLDVIALGLGAFLAFGRIGCLFAGCCHGRPSRHGVRYGTDHVSNGLAPYLSGVRVFPLQVVESAAVCGIVVTGLWLVRDATAPGTAFAWYVLAYDLARFGLEFARGDADRPYLGRLSEAQWTAVACSSALGIASWRLEGTLTALVAGVFVLPVIAAVVLAARQPRIGDARHLRELAMALHWAKARPTDREATDVGVASTSLVSVSAGQIETDAGAVRHYTVSTDRGPLAPARARRLATIVTRLEQQPDAPQVIEEDGVTHLVWGEPVSYSG